MTKPHVPWHHWPMAVLALLFYAVGALDYTFTMFEFGFWTQFFTEEQVTFFTTMPAWLEAVWAISVWGGLLGAWLMWRRNRLSVLLLFVGFAALVFLTAWLTLFTRPSLLGVTGFLGLYVMAGTCALAFLLYLYTRWERSERKLV